MTSPAPFTAAHRAQLLFRVGTDDHRVRSIALNRVLGLPDGAGFDDRVRACCADPRSNDDLSAAYVAARDGIEGVPT